MGLMGKKLTDLTFEEWIIFTFDHSVEEIKLAWHWDPDADWWAGPAAVTVEYLTQAFENASQVFQPFSDAQLNQGLWYIVSNACSNHMFALMDTSVPWPARQRCIRSFHALYEGCVLPRCTPHLSHIDEPGASPLNLVCYMWWDIIPLYGDPKDPAHKEMDQAILEVMASTLRIESIPCQESALHGLGHWARLYPGQVTGIIDRFLNAHHALPDALKSYAMSAYRGCVL